MDLDQPAAGDPKSCLLAGRYELGPVIGVGSSAVVRRACDLRRGVSVAVKQFPPGMSALELRQQRREMTALARLRHPGLVGLLGGGTEQGRPFVVTDLVEGPTLAGRIRAGPPLHPDAVRRLGRQLAAALAHVHSREFIHRDVKPANVLLGNDGRARLADFGIARAFDGTAATTNGSVVGTAAYLAPEQARGEQVGPAADVYALGLVLLEALTGHREYPGGAVESAIARLHRSPRVPDGLPAELGELLVAMTDLEPQRRPTADQVATALVARPASAPRHTRHRRRGWAVTPLAAAVLLGAAIAGGVMVLSEAPQPAPSDTTVMPTGQQP
ncbi:serine/threonine-protein kinase [Pseudonocardia sp. MH-G8]|uniref:serine/threonine-protein kinase n=1 Tax=Pseudonocardia sp. MH-G8 TaxID=1854588 RepID=UPI00130433AD|nr:serine/threonine-protein kinase [Pseudonocardia sp. MH-G8]